MLIPCDMHVYVCCSDWIARSPYKCGVTTDLAVCNLIMCALDGDVCLCACVPMDLCTCAPVCYVSGMMMMSMSCIMSSTGRSLIGECITSVTLMRTNIGVRFPLTNPSKHTPCGYIRFHHAELCVISTRGARHYRHPNVHDAMHPTFERLTSCVLALSLRGVALPKRGIWKSTRPHTQVEMYAWMPEGGWKQPAGE